MKQLIERLEKTTGADRRLDFDIWTTITNPTGFPALDEPEEIRARWFEFWKDENGFPAYTTSIDAALTLVPPDIWWILAAGRTRPNEPLYAVQLRKAGAQIDDPPLTEAEHDANAAITICIAVLEMTDSHSPPHPTRTNP